MTRTYSNPALDAELAYRREVLEASRGSGTVGGGGGGKAGGRGGWFRDRRRTC